MNRMLIFAVAALALLAAVTGFGGAATASAASSPVTVSLTFDDSTASQELAAPILASHGMNATFYAISGRIGTSGYLTQSDLLSLQAAGNEIGDHTVTHINLTSASTDEAARQVCDARVQLMSWGLHVWDFAYPQGGTSPALEQIVKGCNLNSARLSSGLVSPGTCNGCPYAGGIPPADVDAIRAADSVQASWSLAQIEGLVTQAQSHGGGWVPITFHKLCAGCDTESIPPAELSSFLDWLQGQQGVQVKTVHQVIGGAELPPVSGPVATPPPDGLLQNGSLETDANANGVPDCWTIGGSGTNTFTAGQSSYAHSGTEAETVSITSFTSGDRRLVTTQDLGQCAPAAIVGDRYTASAYLTGSGTMKWVAYYRNAQDTWVYWTQSANITPGASYAQTTWQTPALPAGATAISVGISLRSVGTFTADDFALADSTPSDRTAPAVSITSPASGSIVANTVAILANATDNVGVASVRFYLDGVSLGSKTSQTSTGGVLSYKWSWDTTGVANGTHTLTAVATDTSGNQATSAPVTVQIGGGDTVKPQVAITSPASGATVQGTVGILASATDNVGVVSVRFYLDGVSLGSKTSQTSTGGVLSYKWNWATAGVAAGSHTLTAVATDAAGNQATSAPVTVTVG